MARTNHTEAHARAPFRKATALAASVSLLVPGFVPPAFAQDNAEIIAACEAEFAGRPNRLERCLTRQGVNEGAAPEAPAVDAEAAGDVESTEGNGRKAKGDRAERANRAAEAEAPAKADAELEADAEADGTAEPASPTEPEVAEEPRAPADATEPAMTDGQATEAPRDEEAAGTGRARDADRSAEAGERDGDGGSEEERVRRRLEAEGQDGNAAEAPRAEENAASGDTDAAADEGGRRNAEPEAKAAGSGGDRTRREREQRRQANEGGETDVEPEAEAAESDGDRTGRTREERRQANEGGRRGGKDSAIAEDVASRPEPELNERQRRARDQASQALEQLQGNGGSAAAAIAGEESEAEVEEETIAEGDVRTSSEDFETEAVVSENDDDDDDDDGGLSSGAKLALGALGALAVGTVLANRSRVVSNSGDRVVVQQDDGALQVFKDDDALLRQSGDDVRTERFDDGSTRTTVTRPNGSRIVTIRDASLRVLRRDRIDPDGTRYTLIDDTEAVEPVDVATLPEPIVSSRSGQSGDPLRDALEREAGTERRFSLAQVRSIPEVRALAPAYEVNTVTFASGSAAISPEQAANLTSLAREVLGTIRENPKEVFLIEGHTDAVGDAAYNLALSDRRAETLALALNEYFDVPVENMVVQGYGEEFLKVPTEDAEQENRRATVRQITGLLRTAAAN
ncbi:OmpA family protein [uncultured Jannaschia sp.]|uniref:OmpA family protein n=1 Tax=uncultured Jannaschia sp. TaxID=293347 RepID=UPI002630EAFD|nr:OmpA family protein [uncultured Jannaschia sp.]